jgi:hypothetical protein
MSKKNMLLGVATGKVGDLVFYRAGGEQRTRTRVTPANPRSYNQQVQRSKIAEVVNAYRALSALLKETFPNRPTKQSAFNAFSAANMPIVPTLTKEDAKVGLFNPAPFFIAKGGLSNPFGEQTISASAFTVDCGVINGSAPTTVGALLTALNELHPCCIVDGSKIVFAVANVGNVGMGEAGTIVMKVIKLDNASTVTLSSLGVTATKDSGTNQLKLSVPVDAITSIAGVVLLTPQNDGGWDCPVSQMVMGSGAETKYNMYFSGAGVDVAAASYNAAAPSCLLG